MTGPTTQDAAAPARRRGPYAKTAVRRRQVLDAALGQFAARGYRATSLREVAAAAGISVSTLMHHFPSKEQLLLATLRHRDEVGVTPTPATPDAFLVGVLEQARRNTDLRGLIEVYTVLCAEATTSDHPGAGYFVGRFDLLRDGYADHFAELARRGRLRPGTDPEVAATSLVALWDGLQLQWLHQPDRVDVAACLEAYLALVVAPEPGRARAGTARPGARVPGPGARPLA